MFDYFDRLRKKPERERRTAVLKISATATVIIAVIWIATTVIRVRGMDFSLPKDGKEPEVPSLSDTFSTFSARMKDIFSGSATYEADSSGEN